MQMYLNDSTLRTGISHARASLPDVLALIESKKFQPEQAKSQIIKEIDRLGEIIDWLFIKEIDEEA
jgi:hypothetical protein